jgi:tetraacyldisaccharide 4'-kinase
MSRVETIAKLAWERRGLGGRALRLALSPAAAAVSVVVRARSLAYRLRLRRPRRLAAGVVSVGNLTVGGTGKTPTALWVAEQLRSRGYRVAILSRGYGGTARKPTIVSPDRSAASTAPYSSDWQVVGDETVLLARRFGGHVIVARKRADAGELACRELDANVLVLDDGFQHRSLARQFDLVCLRDGSFADPALLPAGPFREPLSALGRAHAVLLTKGRGGDGAEAWLRQRLGDRPVLRADLVPVCLVTSSGGGWNELPLGRLAGRRALAVSGVADPAPFYRTLHEWEAQVQEFLEFPDHYAYTLEDWKEIAAKSREFDLIVTTEKDLVKLEHFPFAREKLVAVRVSMEIEDGERLMERIVESIEPALASGKRTGDDAVGSRGGRR